MNTMDYIAAAPEITLLGLICGVMIADLFVEDDSRIVTFWLSIASLVAVAAVLYVTAGSDRQLAFYGAYVADPLSNVLKMSALLFVGLSFFYARDYLRANDLHKGEFYLLGLFGLLGMMIMMSANSLLTMYLGLETLALSLYALVAIDRKSATSAESAMKYFVLGAIASGVLLYGISWVYGVTGSLQFHDIAMALSADSDLNSLPLWFGLAFLVVGIAFKFGAVPFHMWLPDVYHGAPTPVTLYLTAAPKVASYALAIRLLAEGLGDMRDGWQDMLIVLSVLSMVVGNLVAIAQTNLKRMLAYSTISHVGFILLGILAGTTEGYQAALFYTITYVIMAVGSFGMILLLSREGFEADRLDDFKGLNRRSPWFAAVMLMLMFSTAGVPPFVGFWAKVGVIGAVLDLGYTWLAAIAVLFSVVGAFYYLRVVKLMYFDEPEGEEPLVAGTAMRATVSLNGLAVLALGIFPAALLNLCIRVFQ